MERKLVKQGRSALTMTLPHTWTAKYGLTDKDSVFVREEKDYLIVRSKEIKTERVFKVDISGMGRGLAYHIITGKFIEGYDKFVIKHDNFKFSQEIGSGFFGMIVEEHTNSKLVMKDIIKEPRDSFIELFKRGCQLLIQQVRTLRKMITENATKNDVKNEERLLDTHLFYCLRYINKYERIDKSYRYFLLTTTIESVGDFISEIAKCIEKKDLEKINLLVDMIENYVTALFQNNMKKMYKTLVEIKSQIERETFIDGLILSVRETLYNYVGFIVDNN